ncbi:MAG: DUF4412 domain-containing protein [Thermodesulfobacteriota bacterium]
MPFQNIIRVSLILFAFTVISFSNADADLYWESDSKSQGIPGQQDGIQLVKNYLKGNSFRIEMPDSITIMDMDQMKIFNLDPKKKTYNEVDMKQMGQMPEMEGEAGKQFQGIMKKMMGSFKVVPTTETRKISGYKCTKHNVSFMGTSGEYWISNEVEGLDELLTYSKKSAKVMGRNPMLKQMNFSALTEELKGFPVETTMKIGNGTTTSTLKKIERKGLSTDLFKVPAGYKMTDQ